VDLDRCVATEIVGVLPRFELPELTHTDVVLPEALNVRRCAPGVVRKNFVRARWQ
jgi:hypothetical protein